MSQITTELLINAVNEIQKRNEPVTYTSIAAHLPHNMMSGKRFSREAIRLALQRSPEGRFIYSSLTRQMVKTPKNARLGSIVVEETSNLFQGISSEKDIIVALPKITQQLVAGRYIYGSVPLAIARYAKGVYIYEDGGIYLCKVSTTRIRGKED